MRIILRLFAAVVLLVVAVVGYAFMRFSYLSDEKFVRPEFSISAEVANADAQLGQRIYTVRLGCVECHGENLTGAKVMENPAMGSIHGSNLTRLQNWTDEEIAAAVRFGIHKEGRSLRFMPSFDYDKVSKTDIAAVIAYIRSVPEAGEPSHANSFGPMARILSAFGQMPVMFPAFHVDQSPTFGDKPTEGATAEFGRYLANACMGCHGHEFKGGKIPGGDPSWPAASNIRLGAFPHWNEEAFRRMIETGVSPTTNQPMRAPMPVTLLKQLNETEIKALWKFLSTLK